VPFRGIIDNKTQKEQEKNLKKLKNNIRTEVSLASQTQ
jgi:hypothetical protein